MSTTAARLEQPIQCDVIAGLRDAPKHLPCRLLYDARGAELFEQITGVEDYYLTRAELALLEARLPAIAALVGPRARVIEPGSGAGRKTRMLLAALDRPAVYVPIDVAEQQLAETATTLREAFPGLEVLPVLGDYTQSIAIPATKHAGKTVVFFPGSTIGNFEPDEARKFLGRLANLAGPDALLILGADANGNHEELLRAYDDSEGVTAAFNLNVLAHLNATHDATFNLDAFTHRAVWNAARSRIEMHLVSRRDQVVMVAGEPIMFENGESIITEHCYKHSPGMLEHLLVASGWRVTEIFVDTEQRMRIWVSTTRSTNTGRFTLPPFAGGGAGYIPRG
ncbi:MAG TPA: L-histidine N(alpha)-methyltransferase [Kofleriaceae bacterium]|jgi:dimethylhistidine N-methyltransferase